MSTEPLEGLRRHKLFPKPVADALPDLYANEGLADPLDAVCYLKLFSPYSQMTLYVTEAQRGGGDPGDVVLFGYMTGMTADEWGYSSLREHQEASASIGLAGRSAGRLPLIERDCHWTPRTVRECIEKGL